MRWFLSACLLSLVAAGPALAQAPTISEIFPPGAQQGTSVGGTIAGANLNGDCSFWISGTGVKLEKRGGNSAAECPVRLSIDPGAEVGRREIRVITPGGVSNAGRLWVGRYPDLLEKEPNDSFSTAQLLAKVPVTVSGRADRSTDADYYAVDAGAGQTWVFTLHAARYYSKVIGFLGLYDSTGRSLVSAIGTALRDPSLTYTFQTSGRYLVQARDLLYRGGSGYTYRLTLGRLPLVTRWQPLGGRRGTTVKLHLEGVNLGELDTVEVALPVEAQRSRVRVVPRTPLGLANPIDVRVGDTPEVTEQEPNDAAATARRAPALPVVLDGWIGAPGDRDTFAFEAKEKQPVLVDALAQRVGSRLDPVLRILDRDGKELASNDDAVGRDARLTFTPPATGTYFVEIRELTDHGGSDYFYRLALTPPPPPDFALAMGPDNPTVPAGAAAAVMVAVQRAGYNGEIPLRVEGLPPGVTASPAVIRSGQNSVVFTLSAAADAKPGGGPIHVVGTAKIGDQGVERTAVGQESYTPAGVKSAMQPLRETELVLAAVGPAPPYTLSVSPPDPQVKAGEKQELVVRVNRKPDFKENVAVALRGLPAGVSASALSINKDQTEGKITLTASAGAQVGPASVAVEGTARNVGVAVPAFTLIVQAK